MNKGLVLSAIAKDIVEKFDAHCALGKHSNRSNEEYRQRLDVKILDLCEAYWEIRGHRGTVSYVWGCFDEAEPNEVASIEQLVQDRR